MTTVSSLYFPKGINNVYYTIIYNIYEFVCGTIMHVITDL